MLPWTWKATLAADTRHCATRSGGFEIDFIRIKEFGPDVQFTEKFRWNSGQFDVSMEMTVDENVLEYRVGFIALRLPRFPLTIEVRGPALPGATSSRPSPSPAADARRAAA